MLMYPGSAPIQHLVLYIEDNLANLALVEELLSRRENYSLISSGTGRQGIVLASTRHPHVILMDINLPDMSGLEVLKYLRDHAATAHIPVIALSSNAFPRQIEQGIEAGFFRYLTKPFNIGELMNCLDACLNFSTIRPQLAPMPAIADAGVPRGHQHPQ